MLFIDYNILLKVIPALSLTPKYSLSLLQCNSNNDTEQGSNTKPKDLLIQNLLQ